MKNLDIYGKIIIFLIAVVALVLSILAVTKKCDESFSDNKTMLVHN
tara:strand:+ start:1439 stop:1576 length:138 start_codon:yes stop_codon:yes gene_type:complete